MCGSSTCAYAQQGIEWAEPDDAREQQDRGDDRGDDLPDAREQRKNGDADSQADDDADTAVNRAFVLSKHLACPFWFLAHVSCVYNVSRTSLCSYPCASVDEMRERAKGYSAELEAL
jgi:hypothetical protein